MFNTLVKKWHRRARPAEASAVPYAVSCACGHVLRGPRQRQFQTPSCPSCGGRVFVLPASPLPVVAPLHASVKRSALPKASWYFLAPAAALFLLITVGMVVWILAPKASVRGTPGPASLLAHWRAGQEALHGGKVQIAAQELGLAAALQERFPTALAPPDRRRLRQARREAGLLADLLTETLTDVGRRAARLYALDPREWQAYFDRRYRGRSLVLDGQVRRDGPDRYQLTSPLRIAGDPGLVNISPLALLRHLPLDQPQRVLFGVRLAAVYLSRNGTWVFEVEPNSGVLLTDPGATQACLPNPHPDAERDRLLVRQKTWADELP